MKSILLIAGIFALAFAAPGKDPTIQEFEKEYKTNYETKHMEAEAEDFLKREEQAIDEENEKFEKGEKHFKEAVNENDDMDPEEFYKTHNGAKADARRIFTDNEDEWYARGLLYDPEAKNTPEEEAALERMFAEYDRQSIPSSWDSRAKGWVSPIQNQASCGSCAAFATGAALESCFLKAGAPATSMDIAEQQMLDCGFGKYGNNGCNGAPVGGYPKYLAEAGGVSHENDYPYQASTKNGAAGCKQKAYWSSGAKIVDKVLAFKTDDKKLQQLVMNHGAIVIALVAGESGFMNYKSGVYDTCSYPNKQPDHAVALIGWGTENGQDYWLIKNSWGKNWGDSGYMKIKRGTCGVHVYGVAALKCEKSGTPSPSPAPAPSPSPKPKACDVNHWWLNLTGNPRTLETIGPLDGKFRKIKAKCFHGQCNPINDKGEPLEGNACEIICGVDPCKQDFTDKCGFPKYRGDTFCDDENNTAACGYDGGDCCLDNVKKDYCKECKCKDPNGKKNKPTCKNVHPDKTCEMYKLMGDCDHKCAWGVWMKKYCAKLCGFC